MGSGDLRVFAYAGYGGPDGKCGDEGCGRPFAGRFDDRRRRDERDPYQSSSGVGAEIVASAVLTEVEGRKLTFNVGARDAEGMIGEGFTSSAMSSIVRSSCPKFADAGTFGASPVRRSRLRLWCGRVYYTLLRRALWHFEACVSRDALCYAPSPCPFRIARLCCG